MKKEQSLKKSNILEQRQAKNMHKTHTFTLIALNFFREQLNIAIRLPENLRRSP